MAAGKCIFMYFLLLFTSSRLVWGRNHTLTLADDARKSFGLSTFGLLKNGRLMVSVRSFSYAGGDPHDENPVFGFSLEKTSSDGIASYMDSSAQQCVISDAKAHRKKYFQYSLVLFEFDFKKMRIVARRVGKDFSDLHIRDVGRAEVKSGDSETTTTAPPDKDKTPTSPVKKSKVNTDNSDVDDKNVKNTHSSNGDSSVNTGKSGTDDDSAKHINHSKENSINLSDKSKDPESSEDHDDPAQRKRWDIEATASPVPDDIFIPLRKTEGKFYVGEFEVLVLKDEEEGLYNLYFHNCNNYEMRPHITINMEVNIIEVNANKNYLSAGEKPLPVLFGGMGGVFLVAAVYWMHILRKNREKTFKIHYMMLLLIIIKALDLIFNALNFHFISRDGKPAEPWPVLYYIIHLMKGALLFTTIVLIGTGYFFIKHVLSDRDKKIFVLVIPLQVIANTAQIVMDSTEKGQKQYATWKEIFILVDLLCCGAILFPVIWSIRHLQEASQTDGKAAMNLAKLKLFRHYYIMIVCYIYFTRIIVYLLRITVPFQYEWLDEFFMNLATFVFFVVTGYKFQPASNNPYLRVPEEDEEEELEMDEVITTSGATDGVMRVNHHRAKEDSHAV